MTPLLPALLAVFLSSSASRAAYIFPELAFQAKTSGGLKAYLPDSCGVDGFGLQIKSKSEPSWRTGNGTKIGKFWTWEDKARALKAGDELEYSPRVWYRGSSYSLPISRWYVPELVNDYSLPPLKDLDQDCPSDEKDSTTPKSNEEDKSQKEPPREPAQKQPPRPGPGRRRKVGPRPKSLSSKEEKSQEDNDHKDDNGHKDDNDHKVDNDDDDDGEYETGPPQPPSTGHPFSISCNWLDPPRPGLTKEEVLERQLAILQCEMSSFLERTTKLTSELNKELLDIKKLNYATVARMQRLESLIRTIPRAVPFSYI